MLIPEGLHSVERDVATHLPGLALPPPWRRRNIDLDAQWPFRHAAPNVSVLTHILRLVGFDLCRGGRISSTIFSRGGKRGLCGLSSPSMVNSASSLASVTLMGLLAGSTLQMMLIFTNLSSHITGVEVGTSSVVNLWRHAVLGAWS